jgi:uncharacterized protein YraI
MTACMLHSRSAVTVGSMGQMIDMRASIMLGAGLFAIATGFANAAVTTGNHSVLRAGPGSTFSVIDRLPAGTKVEVSDCTSAWCQVGFNGMAGFVATPDLGTASHRKLAPSTTENVRRSHKRVNPRSSPDRFSDAGRSRSNKGSESSAHTLTPSALPFARP